MFYDKKEMPIGILAKVTVISAAMLWATSASSQSTTSTSTSSSSSSAQVESSASASVTSGNSNAQIYLDQSTPGTLSTRNSYSGSYTVRSAPSVQPPSMGSGHPCALSGSIGISLIGGGAGGGMNRVDEACLLAQMGQGQAALIMIARRDAEACFALRQVGSIPSGSVCSGSERRSAAQAQRATVSSKNRQTATRTTAAPISRYVSCSKRADGKILARKQTGTPYSNDQVAKYCRSQMQ
ncbi:hypothetical protein [Celeribacter sp.]|uniref:hypothetical protein n=1 Tax=Celeribacter sp. TaxID=1890673 RepID=UPI003A90D93A